MVILVGEKAREVMLNDELIDEDPPVSVEHWAVPGPGHDQRNWKTPEKTDEKPLTRPLATYDEIRRNDSDRQDNSDQAFGQQRQTNKAIKGNEQPWPPSV